MRPLDLKFVQSATDHRGLPELDAEIAIVGRSNVGKSTLINMLANRKRLAHTSKTPGRTQLLNLFVLDEDPPRRGVMDLPGYGYAAGASKRAQASWQQMIESYLLERESLVVVVVLVDGLVGPTALDTNMLNWLRASSLSHVVVATKHDKVKASKRQKRKKELAEGCGLEPNDVLWVSASSGLNIDTLRRRVLEWLSPNA
ncbi:MAG: YihA family ribosome biogenesis GTP-binding protein [Acidimicrobiales bacterium]|nr:YihA family ribosome biogenesis GTP-binding protein [Acidimicrobiales bacterium]